MGKVVLAYSGGLETTAAIRWLTRERGLKVIALCVNVGQAPDAEEVALRAVSAGAVGTHLIDSRSEFLKGYCWNALRASAKYEGVYLLSAALSRPLIATELVSVAHQEGAQAVAHGSAPRGNDQFRIECSVVALDRNLSIIAPMREWHMRNRDEVLEYAEREGLDMDVYARDAYTHDFNLWGARTSGGDLQNLDKVANPAAYTKTTDPVLAPGEPENITVGFERGDPVRINGEKLDEVTLMERLNALGAKHGVGRLDLIENTLMGFKTREVYEAPGATILHCAHDALERITLDKSTLHLARNLSSAYAEAIYNGMWFSLMRESLDAFFRSFRDFISGSITVQLHKGSASAISGESEFSTFDREQQTLRDNHGALPPGAAEGMLTVARLGQLHRSFKYKPRT
jgi:argininosuccinate synthase